MERSICHTLELTIYTRVRYVFTGFDIRVDHPHSHVVRTCELVKGETEYNAFVSSFLSSMFVCTCLYQKECSLLILQIQYISIY